MEKQRYTAPGISVVYVAPQQMICVSLEYGQESDDTQPDYDTVNEYYLAE